MANTKIKELILAILLFAICVLAITFLQHNNLWLDIAFIFISLLILGLWHNKVDVIYYFTAFILGPLGEISIIYQGAWQYNNPDIFGLPLWAPMAWGAAVTIIRRIAKIIIK